jgi:catechol 2,3-dioxygenase
MDAPNPSASPTFANRTPLHIGAYGLKVRDLDRMTAYYRDLLGLAVIERDARGAKLGAGGVAFLHLEPAPDAKPDDEREAGLYHTAFLMPTRGDLARWLHHIARTRVPITGASDHAVSEAIYLDDPEGNGIEVYRDRKPEEWIWRNGFIHMTTERLNLDDLAAAAGPQPYDGAPEGLRIGHIHLRVGDVDTAEQFYTAAVGLNVTREGRHGATFMSSGGYHHHVGANVWHSPGAGRRDPERAGLAWFTIEAADEAAFAGVKASLAKAAVPISGNGAGLDIADPWGTRVRIVRA